MLSPPRHSRVAAPSQHRHSRVAERSCGTHDRREPSQASLGHENSGAILAQESPKAFNRFCNRSDALDPPACDAPKGRTWPRMTFEVDYAVENAHKFIGSCATCPLRQGHRLGLEMKRPVRNQANRSAGCWMDCSILNRLTSAQRQTAPDSL